MKKICIFIFIILSLFLTCFFLSCDKETDYIDDYVNYKVFEGMVYRISEGECEIIGYDSDTLPNELVIPSNIEGIPVVYIGPQAFMSSNIRKVFIPSSVKKIYESSFYDCSYLREVEIDNGVEYIGREAFGNCISLSKIELPNSLKEIRVLAFYNTNISEISIPNSVEKIGRGLFCSCYNLKYLEVPFVGNTVDDYKTEWMANLDYCFFTYGIWESTYCRNKLLTLKVNGGALQKNFLQNNDTLEAVILGDDIICLEDDCFKYSKIQSLTIGNVGSVGNLSIPESINKIYYKSLEQMERLCLASSFYDPFRTSYSAFIDGVPLTEIVLKDGVTEVNDYMFACCDNLESVFLPESVEKIGTRAFFNCSSLNNINLVNNIHEVSGGAFRGCKKLLINGLPKSLEIIGNDAFRECIVNSNLIFPDNIISVGNAAFYEAENLETVTFSDSIIYIGSSCFYNCSSLKTVKNIPSKLEYLGSYCFYGTNVSSIGQLPSTLGWLGSKIGCSIEGSTSDRINLSPSGYIITYHNYPGRGVITIKCNMVYHSAYVGYSYMSGIILAEGVMGVGDNAFDCGGSFIVVPKSLKYVGYNCFGGKNIYYNGTEEEWKDFIEKEAGYLGIREVFYYSDTKINNGWHYVDGVPTKW